MRATNNGQTERALLFGLDEGGCCATGSRLCAFGRLALDAAEFFCIC